MRVPAHAPWLLALLALAARRQCSPVWPCGVIMSCQRRWRATAGRSAASAVPFLQFAIRDARHESWAAHSRRLGQVLTRRLSALLLVNQQSSITFRKTCPRMFGYNSSLIALPAALASRRRRHIFHPCLTPATRALGNAHQGLEGYRRSAFFRSGPCARQSQAQGLARYQYPLGQS